MDPAELNRIESSRLKTAARPADRRTNSGRTAADSPLPSAATAISRTDLAASSMSRMQSGSQPRARHQSSAAAAAGSGSVALRDPPAALSAAAAAVAPSSESPPQRLLTELAQLKHTQKKIRLVEQHEEEKMAQLRRSAGAASSAPLCSVRHASRASTAAAAGLLLFCLLTQLSLLPSSLCCHQRVDPAASGGGRARVRAESVAIGAAAAASRPAAPVGALQGRMSAADPGGCGAAGTDSVSGQISGMASASRWLLSAPGQRCPWMPVDA